MNTLTLQSGKGQISTLMHGMLVGLMLTQLPAMADADDRFQKNALFNPSVSLLAAESRGRVMIYDSLENDVVERALNEQFGRIDNMMFTRIRHTDPNGTVSIEDDGC